MDAYLRRIGAARPQRADLAALRDLQLRHLRSVPFENLSVHFGEEIVLEERALLAKIVDGRRGGFCYELNGAYAALLRELGFAVRLLQARVYDEDGRLGIPYDHLALLVETGTETGTEAGTETEAGAGARGPGGEGSGGGAPGRRWLVDVGFGESSHHPLDLDERGDQHDPGGTFRIVPAGHGDLEVHREGRAQYRLETRPRALEEFRAGAWWHRTAPESPFTRSLVCTRITEEGRITLSGSRLVTTRDGEREVRELADDDAVLAAYRDCFGLDLDRLPPDPRRPAGS